MINILKAVCLLIFVISSLFTLYKARHYAPGTIITDPTGKLLTDGKEGMSVFIGKDKTVCNVIIKKMPYKIHTGIKPIHNRRNDENFKTKYFPSNVFRHGNYLKTQGFRYDFSSQNSPLLRPSGFLTVVITVVFLALQGLFSPLSRGAGTALKINVALILFVLVSFCQKQFSQIICECIFAILLSFHTYINLYGSTQETIADDSKKAVTALFLYIFFFLAGKLFFTADITINTLFGGKFHFILRICAIALMLILIVVNLIFAPITAGTKNWIYISGVSMQLSEAVKPLLAFVLICPPYENYYSLSNLLFTFGSSVLCLLYTVYINDTGAFLQIGVIFVTSVLIQLPKLHHAFMLILAGFTACKLIILKSATARFRLFSWLGEGEEILDCFTGAHAVTDPYGRGYQRNKRLQAVLNGALLGNSDFNVLKNVKACDSDLVTALLCENFGILILFLIIALYPVLILCTAYTLREKNRVAQLYSAIAITSLTFAFILNTAGSYSIIPLTGVVSPALSKGISASLYGVLFGSISATSVPRKTRKNILKAKTSEIRRFYPLGKWFKQTDF